jgi:hypothetical protein
MQTQGRRKKSALPSTAAVSLWPLFRVNWRYWILAICTQEDDERLGKCAEALCSALFGEFFFDVFQAAELSVSTARSFPIRLYQDRDGSGDGAQISRNRSFG